jgi:hypothetical protein
MSFGKTDNEASRAGNLQVFSTYPSSPSECDVHTPRPLSLSFLECHDRTHGISDRETRDPRCFEYRTWLGAGRGSPAYFSEALRDQSFLAGYGPL